MIPTVLKQLPSLPLTPNGKIDRRALPDPRTGMEVEEKQFFPATTPTERMLAEIFCEILGCSRISIRTSLLDQGADSLRMFQIASRAHRLGLAVSAKQLMQLHTVEAVAAAVDAAQENHPIVQTAVPSLQRVSREKYRVGV
jgi:aryl carrier-like protein